MFLSHEDISDLTGGLTQHAAQRRWLTRNGIKHLIGADGSPRVLVSHIEALIGSSTKPNKRRAEPDEEGLRRFMGIA